MRLTESIIRHQFKSYYSTARMFRYNPLYTNSSLQENKEKAKKTFEEVLRTLTKNKALSIKVPSAKEDDRKFGKVLGLTGGMIDNVLNGYDKLGKIRSYSITMVLK